MCKSALAERKAGALKLSASSVEKLEQTPEGVVERGLLMKAV
jgi:hypothetical protein